MSPVHLNSRAFDLRRNFQIKIEMVHSASNRRASLAKRQQISKITKRRMKNKREIRNLYNELNAVLPSCGYQHVCGTDQIVLKAVRYINQLHRRVAAEMGVKALQKIQNNARRIALQQFMAMKAETMENNIEVTKIF